jgi:hypothetical protein
MNNAFLDNFFRDKDGQVVIGQPPNIPIIIWLVASLLQLVFKTGQVNSGLDILAIGSLLVWSILELFQGVNYFRRTLGLIVLISLVASKIQLLTANG